MIDTRWARVAIAPAVAVIATLAGACGGGSDFANEPRPPAPLAITGVVTDNSITVSPDSFGGGPINLAISNQTEDSHTVTLEGGEIEEEVGPINPEDTATIQVTLREGRYTVAANSDDDVLGNIDPATIKVKDERQSSSEELLLP